jgi:uncharacterized protein YjbI with pentapeptide repeats
MIWGFIVFTMILLLAVVNIPSLNAHEYSNVREYPCDFKKQQQLEKEAGNAELFMELAKTSKDLCKFSFQGKVLAQFPLRDLNLHDANLRSSNFSSSDAENVKLLWSKLEKASFSNSNLKNANFSHARLNNADLEEANLVGALLYKANLDGTNLSKATFGCSKDDPSKCTDITSASFHGPSCLYNHNKMTVECDEKKLVFTNFKGANNIKSLVYDYSSHLNFPPTLISLRKHLRENGFEREAREITYVIQRGLDEEALFDSSKKSTSDILGAFVRKVAFDYTVEYGVSPSNALVILLYTLIGFSFVYMLMLRAQVYSNSKYLGYILLITPKVIAPGRLNIVEYEDGIFKSESLLRVVHEYLNTLLPDVSSRKLNIKHYFYLYRHAFWFSALSSFHFGWRDLNVGGWLARLQPKQFTYKPMYLFRVLSGVQSLVCIYLLAIFVLSYFGNPWG